MLVSNIREDGKPIGVLPDGEMWFHHDMCYSPQPNRASFLYSIEVPSHGGDTMFANMYEAYARLPQKLKDRIEGRTVLQAFDEYQDRRIDLAEKPLSQVPHCVQPIVIRHPETGRRAIYVNRLMSHASKDWMMRKAMRYSRNCSPIPKTRRSATSMSGARATC